MSGIFTTIDVKTPTWKQWHRIGVGKKVGDKYEYTWNTVAWPDQSDMDIKAIARDKNAYTIESKVSGGHNFKRSFSTTKYIHKDQKHFQHGSKERIQWYRQSDKANLKPLNITLVHIKLKQRQRSMVRYLFLVQCQ